MTIDKIDKYLKEAKSPKQYDIRAAGDGFALSGPLKPGQTVVDYHKVPRVRSYADDGLFDTFDQAMAKLKQLGGILVLKPRTFRVTKEGGSYYFEYAEDARTTHMIRLDMPMQSQLFHNLLKEAGYKEAAGPLSGKKRR